MMEQHKDIQRQPPPQLRTTDWTASTFHEMQHRNSETISPRSMGEGGSNAEVSPEEAETPLISTVDEGDESSAKIAVVQPSAKPITSPAGFQADWRDEMRRIVREEVGEGFQKLYATAEIPSASTVTASPTSQKLSVRFGDRRNFSKRPAGVSRHTSSLEPAAEWGILFDEDGHATHRLGRILRGLAKHIIEEYAPKNSLVITPEKLGLFYSKYRIEPEINPFSEMFTSRSKDSDDGLADFYDDLECQYHLVQKDPRSRPRIPALTPIGFTQYFTTYIRAYPDEEFRRLEKIVTQISLIADDAASDGQQERLPRTIIRDCLPAKYDLKSRKILDSAIDDLLYDLKLQPSGSRPPVSRPTSLEKRASGTSQSNRRRYTPAALRTIGDESATEEYNPKAETKRLTLGNLQTSSDVGAKEGHGGSYEWEHRREHDRVVAAPSLKEGGAKVNPRPDDYVRSSDANLPVDRFPRSSLSSNISSRSQSFSSSFSQPSTPSAMLPPPPVGSRASLSSTSSFSRRPHTPQLGGYTASVPDVNMTSAWSSAATMVPSRSPSVEHGTVANTMHRREQTADQHTGTSIEDGRAMILAESPQELQWALAGIGARGEANPGSPMFSGPGPDKRPERQPSRHRRSMPSTSTEDLVVEDDDGLTWGEYLKSQKAGKRGSGGGTSGWH